MIIAFRMALQRLLDLTFDSSISHRSFAPRFKLISTVEVMLEHVQFGSLNQIMHLAET